jgi:two-component system, chemotaxis family, chemotaxis protein CheY
MIPDLSRPPLDPPKPRSVKRVLVIDDSTAVRQLVQGILAGAGYEIFEAHDGLDGLEKLRSVPNLDLALCDVNMPRMTGLEMVLEAQRSGITVPILMLTTEGQPSMIRDARRAGAKGWIVKPVKPELLLIAVEKIVAAKAA